MHDDGFQEWKDLIGSYALRFVANNGIPANPIVKAGCVRFDGSYYGIADTGLSAKCLEIVASFDSGKANNVVFSACLGGRPQLTKAASGGYGFGYVGSRWPSELLNPYDSMPHTFTYNNTDAATEESIDGIYKASYGLKPVDCRQLLFARAQNSGDNYSGEATIRCVRVYSTALTRKQIARNREIDMLHFSR